MILKFKTVLLVLGSLFMVNCTLGAKEITILYTGSTHAMLYPCGCPIEPDGGVARRATLINELRKNNPDVLVLDAGGFFAGGLLDEYTQNTELDSKRTFVNLKAMELMKYDAVNLSDNEFNFGRKFLEETIGSTKLPFLSCNIKSDKFLPFIIKETGGLKIGIIGASAVFSEQKTGGLKLAEALAQVKSAVAQLKEKKADIIVLLSYAAVNDPDLIKGIKGVDVIIESVRQQKRKEPAVKIGPAIVVNASWQGKKLGKLSLTVEDNKITGYSAEELRLSDKISDDHNIKAILPRCFSDTDCRKNGSTGICQNPGELKADCSFPQAKKVSLFVIIPKECEVCNAQGLIDYLKKEFPGISVSYLYYPGKESEKLIKDFAITALPAYLFGKEIEKERGFEYLKKNLEDKGSFYAIKVEFTGISYYLGREAAKGKLDLFISLYDKDTKELLDLAKEYNPKIHFVAIEQGDKFDARSGNFEVEEYLRSACVAKHYPDIFWDYISCRAKNINSSWWEDCLTGLDSVKIKMCAKADEGRQLLRENIKLNRELQVMFGPAFLMDNREIFGFKSLPTKEQLRKIIKR